MQQGSAPLFLSHLFLHSLSLHASRPCPVVQALFPLRIPPPFRASASLEVLLSQCVTSLFTRDAAPPDDDDWSLQSGSPKIV